MTSGIEGLDHASDAVDNGYYFDMLFGHDWWLQSPGRRAPWEPINIAEETCRSTSKTRRSAASRSMTDADMALRSIPEYRKIAERFRPRIRPTSPVTSPAPGSN